MRKAFDRSVGVLVVGALLVSPGLGSRLASATPPMQEGDPVLGTTILLLTTASAVGTTVGIVYSVIGTQRKDPHARAKVGRAFASYLRRNSDQLVQDVTLGSGRTVNDLAATAAISTNNLPAFGRLLRAHRAELLKLADVRQLSPDRALAFLERMGTLVMNDRVLISDYDAAVAKFGRAG